MARTVRSRSALGATIAALLPPSSSSSRPKRPATRGATARPIRVEPVTDTSATRGSSTSAWPAAGPPRTSWDSAAGAPTRRAASATSAWQASAVSRVFSDGFQTTGSPQTSARAEFHDHTATGKLNAETMPTTPSGCHCSIIRWPGRSVAMVLPNSCRDRPERQVADVDHLLDLAEALGDDLAGLDGDQRAEVLLVLAQQLAQLADQLAAHRRRHQPPLLEGLLGPPDDGGDLVGGVRGQAGPAHRR